MTTNSLTAENIFTAVVKGTNFMTPNIIRYEHIKNGAVELSFGEDDFFGMMWGVTVVRNNQHDYDAGKKCDSLEEAENYINSLK